MRVHGDGDPSSHSAASTSVRVTQCLARYAARAEGSVNPSACGSNRLLAAEIASRASSNRPKPGGPRREPIEPRWPKSPRSRGLPEPRRRARAPRKSGRARWPRVRETNEARRLRGGQRFEIDGRLRQLGLERHAGEPALEVEVRRVTQSSAEPARRASPRPSSVGPRPPRRASRGSPASGGDSSAREAPGTWPTESSTSRP
jgi:hypothetical protein